MPGDPKLSAISTFNIRSADGCSLAVTVEGESSLPALMFSNSMGADSSMWDQQVSDLRGGFRIIRYDARGHGRSDPRPGPYSIEMLARDALSVLDSLEIEQAHWCGISLGGIIGQWLGANAPARINRLVLSNTTNYFPNPAPWQARIDAVKKGGVSAIADAVIAGWLSEEFRTRNPHAAGRAREMLIGTSNEGYIACCEVLSRLDQRDLSPQIACPTLVIAGRHDKSTPMDAGEALSQLIPNAGFAVLEAAHISNIEQPQRFSEELRSFLHE